VFRLNLSVLIGAPRSLRTDRRTARLLGALVFVLVPVLAMAGVCRAQNRDVLCNYGTGKFSAEFRTGVAVRVEAARNGELAARLCRAVLSWQNQKLVIADQVLQVDVDAFGADIGLGTPVIAFQVKKPGDCCVDYEIYSLQKPPRLLRTITGGDFFSAADTDLDGVVEIWTADAAAVDGFDGLAVGQMDFAPPVVLRFTRGKLLDVSTEFQSYYDDKIAKIRAYLNPQDLRDFKSSDGKLPAPVPFTVEALHRRARLEGVKIKVLEIVWSYLYSGRDEAAWNALAELWPDEDADRVRAAILKARATGIQTQVDGGSTDPAVSRKNHASIYDAINETEKGKRAVIPPQPILLQRPPPGPSQQSLAYGEVFLLLVIDSAGKVRSVEPADDTKWFDVGLEGATANWKFIPAFKGDQAVACRLAFVVTMKR
jgi:hypothetical protein